MAESSSTALTFSKIIFPSCVMIITSIALFRASWYSGLVAEHLQRHCCTSETTQILSQLQIYQKNMLQRLLDIIHPIFYKY